MRLILFSLLVLLLIESTVLALNPLQIEKLELVEPANKIIGNNDLIKIQSTIINPTSSDVTDPFIVRDYINGKLYSICSGDCELNFGVRTGDGLKAGQSGWLRFVGSSSDKKLLQEGSNQYKIQIELNGETVEKTFDFEIGTETTTKEDIIEKVNGKYFFGYFVAEGDHKIYTLGNFQHEMKVLSLSASTNTAKLIIDGNEEVFDFSAGQSIDYNKNGAKIKFYEIKMSSTIPVLNFAFLSDVPVGASSSLTLAKFPSDFGLDSGFILVVGERASVDKIVAGVELLKHVGFITETAELINNDDGSIISVPVIPAGRVALDNEIQHNAGNYFVVGGSMRKHTSK